MKLIIHPWKRIGDAWKYRNEPEQVLVLANVYWHGLLVVSIGIFLAAALYGGSQWYSITLGQEAGIIPAQSGSAVRLNVEDLGAAVQGFATREKMHDTLKKNPPKISDPSK